MMTTRINAAFFQTYTISPVSFSLIHPAGKYLMTEGSGSIIRSHHRLKIIPPRSNKNWAAKRFQQWF